MVSDDPFSRQERQPLWATRPTRRAVVKQVAKVAYSAPLVAASLRLNTPRARADDLISGEVVCPEPTFCGDNGGDCVLFSLVTGGSVCGLDRICDEVEGCTADSDCPDGEACGVTCGCADKPTSCVAPCPNLPLAPLGVASLRVSGPRQSGRKG